MRFIFCDISKASSKVWLRGVHYEFKLYGICNQIANGVRNFSIERKEKLTLNSFSSPVGPTTSGVPKESVLGLFLFLSYTNDNSYDI